MSIKKLLESMIINPNYIHIVTDSKTTVYPYAVNPRNAEWMLEHFTVCPKIVKSMMWNKQASILTIIA